MGKLTIKTCPICESEQLEPSLTCVDHFTTGEMFCINVCRNCGFMLTQNAPDEEEIGHYYETNDYVSHTDTRKGLIHRIYHLARRFMLWRKSLLIENLTHKKIGRILDYGAGTGYFANAMKQRGWDVRAIEPNRSAREFAAANFKINIRSPKAIKTLRKGSYDVITLWHVLEHIHDLNKLMEQFNSLLSEKGLLIIAVPNHTGYDAGHYGALWAAYDVPRHLWHFSPSNIQQLGAKHGFILAERHTMPLDAFYVSMLTEKQMHHSLAFLRGLFVGLIAFFNTMAHKDKSSSLIYVFRKK